MNVRFSTELVVEMIDHDLSNEKADQLFVVVKGLAGDVSKEAVRLLLTL